jgi:hypothetical protein
MSYNEFSMIIYGGSLGMILKVECRLQNAICEAPALLKGTPPGVIFPVTLLKSILELNA